MEATAEDILLQMAPAHGPNYATALALKLACKEYWNGDEASGQNLIGAKNGLDLTQHNTVGAASGYRTFVNASSQYADHTDHATLDVSGDFGVFFWMKCTAHIDFAGWVSKYTGSADEFAVYNSGANNYLRFGISTNGAGITDQVDSTVNIEDGAAHSVAAWVDAAGGTLNIKVDAEATVSQAFVGAVTGRTSAFRIGSLEGSAFFPTGAMRMLGYFNQKFTAADITYLKNGGAGKTYAQLVADAA